MTNCVAVMTPSDAAASVHMSPVQSDPLIPHLSGAELILAMAMGSSAVSNGKRNAQRASTIAGIVGLFAGGTDNNGDDIIAIMTSFTANLFMAGHGRDREREADLFASFYLNETDVGDRPLLNSFRKLKFARDAHDPFGDGGGGLFATHPHIEERLDRAGVTTTASFLEENVFQGVTEVVAGYRIQRRPWPEMTERVGALLDEFPGPAVHDATGAGSAIGEFPALEAHRQLQGVTMVGRDRVDLFRNYIAAIERHEIVCPRIDVFYTEHLYCGEDDLFGSGHPPDTVVALALAYHAFKTGRRPGDYGVTI